MTKADPGAKFQFKVCGPKARFEAQTEGRGMTYLVPTYMSLLGICNSLSWAPGITWVIDRVRIINPIRKQVSENNKEFLTDVEYRVEAHMEFGPQLKYREDQKRHISTAQRRINQGGRSATLGDKHCPATISPCSFDEGEGVHDLLPSTDFGRMFHSMLYKADGTPYARVWQNYIMRNGVINFLPVSKCEKTSVTKPTASKA